jgi:hypothetical protein
MLDEKSAADALRAEVQDVDSHKSRQRAARHLVEAAPNRSCCRHVAGGQADSQEAQEAQPAAMGHIARVADAATRRVVTEFVADVGPDDVGVEELRNFTRTTVGWSMKPAVRGSIECRRR